MHKTDEGLTAQDTQLGCICNAHVCNKSIQLSSMMVTFQEDEQLTKFWESQEVHEEHQLSTYRIKLRYDPTAALQN